MEENKNNLVEVIRVLYKWRKHIFIICGVAFLGSAIISLLLPNYYKSTTIFYPYSPKLADSRTLYTKDANYDIFGRSADIDRLISISNSSLIVKDMIKEFDLIQHYNIDTSTTHVMYDAMKEFRENLEVIKNDEGAIELSILDQNDSMAVEMVKIMVGKINYINLKTTLQNNEKTLSVYQEHLKNKTAQLNSITDSLKKLKNEFNILNPETESRLLAEKISELKIKTAEAKAKNNTSLAEQYQKYMQALELEKFNEAADIVRNLDQQLLQVTTEFNEISESYLQTQSAINNQLQTLFIVEDAIKAEKKHKPVRWVIVVSTTIIALLLSSLMVVILDFYQKEVKHLLKD